jgi:hypothetical protein
VRFVISAISNEKIGSYSVESDAAGSSFHREGSSPFGGGFGEDEILCGNSELLW